MSNVSKSLLTFLIYVIDSYNFYTAFIINTIITIAVSTYNDLLRTE